MNKERVKEIEEKLKEAVFHIYKKNEQLYQECQKYGPLCIEYLLEIKKIPRIEVFEENTKHTGFDVLHEDFWTPYMICALVENCQILERKNARTN